MERLLRSARTTLATESVTSHPVEFAEMIFLPFLLPAKFEAIPTRAETRRDSDSGIWRDSFDSLKNLHFKYLSCESRML